MKDSTKNKAPVAPTSADASNATGAKKPRVALPEKGTLVKKKGAQAADPTRMAKPSRKNVLNPEAGNAGARYGIRVAFQKSVAPEAGATQGNGRLFAAAIKRQAPNFKSGMVDHN